MRDFDHDLRYAWRQLGRTPGFTAVAVLTLALGIGVSTMFLAVVNALLYKPVPATRIDDVRVVARRSSLGVRQTVSLDALTALERTPTDDVLSVAAVFPLTAPAMVQVPGRAERLEVEGISGAYAAVLSLSPQAGRWLTRDDNRSAADEKVAVISDAIWRGWFGAAPSVVGAESLRIDGVRFRIVGVAPPLFRGLSAAVGGADLWIALRQVPEMSPYAREHDLIARGVYLTLVKMRPGFAEVQAASDLEAAVLAAQSRPPPASTRYALTTVSDFVRARHFGMAATMLSLLAGLVLLAACANLANMLYARGSERAGETAVRMSLGATPARILRLPLAETLLVALLAAATGLGLALAGTQLLTAVFPTIRFSRYLQLTLDLRPDPRVFASAFVVGVGAALLVGLLAAWRASRMLPARALAPSGVSDGMTGRGGSMRTLLVSVQVTAALLLVMATGLVWETFREQLRRDEVLNYRVHYAAERVVTGRVDLALHDYLEDRGQGFYHRVVDAVGAIDGIDRVAIADAIPGAREPAPRHTMFEAMPDGPRAGMNPRFRASYVVVSPGFFDALGLELLAGRDFAPPDVEGAPQVAIVSRSFADAVWPGTDPIGRELRFVGGSELFTVVGLSADPVASADEGAMRPANFVFLPFAQHYRQGALLVARADEPLAVYDPIRAAIAGIDDEVALSELSTVEESALDWLRPVRAIATLMTAIGALALGLAMLGIYGVVGYFVSRRTREFGIRLALGSTRSGVRKLVFDYTVHVMLVGLLPGVFVASSASRWVESRQFDVLPNEISTWIAVLLVTLGSGVAAGALPAWRASRVDPNVALRSL